MNLEFLSKGLVIGFSVAAPVGPIGVLCINRTLTKSFSSGLVSGLGAATADLFYGIVAGLGLTTISSFMIGQQHWIQVFGLLFLFYLGLKTIFRKRSNIEYKNLKSNNLISDYFSTLLLTATNPLTILFFSAIFAGLGLTSSDEGVYPVIQLSAGVFIGSSTWWVIINGLTNILKNKINEKILKRIDWFSGIIILFFCSLLFVKLLKDFH